ncbi:MAG: hypothetical protein ACRDOH_08250 [Streptosporangiaceae bacterium]
MAPTPAPPADAGTLAQALALLGTVTDTGDAPPELAALHLTRTLVAAAEQQAVAAEHAASKAGGGRLPDGHDVAGHQGTYDLATAKAALTMLAVTYWRSQRLNAGVQALARAFTGADARDGDEEPENSPVKLMWDLAVPAAAATEALLSFLGAVTVDDDPRGSVQALDAATALLVSAGHRAARLRSATGMSPVPDLLGPGRE